MRRFAYRAFGADGARVSGMIEARSRDEALSRLHRSGLHAYEAAEGTHRSRGFFNLFSFGERRLGLAARASLARELATLLQANLPADTAVRVLGEQARSAAIRKFIAQAGDRLASGDSLSQALHQAGTGYPSDEIGLIQAGERTGSLAAVFEDLSAMLEHRAALRARIVSALVYPAILMLMAVVSLAVIATVLIPSIAPLFEQTGAQMPLLVRIVIGVGALAHDHGFLIAGLVFVLMLLAPLAWRTAGAKRIAEAMLLNAPLLCTIIRGAEMARICRALGTLIKNGVPVLQALSAARNVARYAVLRDGLAAAAEQVSTGARLAQALKSTTIMEPRVVQLVSVGEETNRLDTMLLHAARSAEVQTSERIERLMTLLTPFLTIGLGAMVGGLIMSVMQAILAVNELAIR